MIQIATRRFARGASRLICPLLSAGVIAFADSSPAISAADDPAARADTVVVGSDNGRTAAEPYYFYHRLGYGSDALIHPVSMIINGGYGILQLDNRANDPWAIDYRQGARNVWRNLRDPFGAIQADGWWAFLAGEIIPVSVRREGGRYWPNYTQHLIGGGMSYRMITEWYRAHDYPRPRLWSVTTMMAYHFLNEVVESNKYEGWSTDPVADLYLFDPLGILLFESDKVSRFFSQTLHMADWSYQPCYDPHHRTLENNGQNFALKYGLGEGSPWSLFYHYGTHAELGFSHTWDDGRCLSAGVGMKAKELITVTERTNTVDLALSAGVFYDRNNSLLAALLYAATKDYRVRLNLYSGLLSFRGLKPGFFIALDGDDHVLGGVMLNLFTQWPLGLASSR